MKANKFLEDLFGSRVETLKTTEQGGIDVQSVELCKHIIALTNDSYLVGHPEWDKIVNEAINLLAYYEDIEK